MVRNYHVVLCLHGFIRPNAHRQSFRSLVPKRYPKDIKLGTWVHTQRIQYRKLVSGSTKKESPLEGVEGEGGEKIEDEKSFRLTEDRRRRLDEIGFIWSARETEKTESRAKMARNSYDDQWDAMFERLKAYKERNGVSLLRPIAVDGAHGENSSSVLFSFRTGLSCSEAMQGRSKARNLGRYATGPAKENAQAHGDARATSGISGREPSRYVKGTWPFECRPHGAPRKYRLCLEPPRRLAEALQRVEGVQGAAR